ncbi:prepilin-type N-terminal cleavage/methylation domain-containing protein [Ruficoccus amylovorans]|uniref:Prepilin-type N-terminal cleavage/methylation domain-containing protein n=1 Tax=Ruficoccus amylovorans TaxID=1804625 RepID=A0A842HFZ3_9BACT|nr:prepilin-type N-terminal cleavage/methylation domain-containing protein [Ruficoccus amylovorans]MBC2595120.1 prepilin-type N-terminal cleavage/methylation domain-containing protein [Ruficoccus amylovorans]
MKKNSKKGFTLVEIMIVVVIIGLLAAMAIPAFNKVREESRMKTITNNLRQVAGAGQRYILENGVETVEYGDLVATYFATIKTVAGEDYTALVVRESGGVLTVEMNNGSLVPFTY